MSRDTRPLRPCPPRPVGRARHERGLALLAVLFALTLLMLLALPFAVSMSVGADAAMRDVEQAATEQASASVRDVLLADAAGSHPLIDPTPQWDGLDEFPRGVQLPPAFEVLRDEGRVLLGGEVEDLQRYLSLDAASPLALANVLGTSTRLVEDLLPDATAALVEDASALPDSGYLWVADEVLRYEQRDGNALLGLERGVFREEGFADGSEPIAAEALVLDYRCVLAVIWPHFGRGDGSRRTRQPFRAVGELLEIASAGLGTFTTGEIDALERAFAVDVQAQTAPVWGRPERVFNDLVPGRSKVLTVKSALHVGGGSVVRLRDLETGAVEYALVMSTSTQRLTQELLLPSVFELHLLLPVSGGFRGGDTVVEPLVPPPVNVNTAPLEVLAALFRHVRRSADLRVVHENQRRQAAPPSISPALAEDLAGEIVAARVADQGGGGGPYTGWQDLVERLFAARVGAEGDLATRDRWVVLYRNLQTGRDSVLEMGTAPVCFESGPWVAYRAAASRSRSVVAAGVVGRHERTGFAAVLPGFRIERRWATQLAFERAFELDRRAPFWVTSPINLGHPQPGSLGNDPAGRFFPHLVPVAYPGLGLGAPRFPVDDEADAGIEPGVATAPAGGWPGTNPPRAFDSFAQANHRRGHDLQKDGPYLMNNVGPQAPGGNAGNARSTSRRHDQLSFPFSQDGGFMARFGLGFWLEPQSLDARYLFDHGDGDPNRNRLSLVGRDGNLVFEVLDEAGVDPNPGDSPAGVLRTASEIRLPLAELGLPADTAVHVSVSAPSGRPADLALAVDGTTRGTAQYVTWLTAAIQPFDPTLGNNAVAFGQNPASASGNDRYLDVQVESTEGFPPMGVLRIGLELFEYTSINGNSFRCRFRDSIGGRGARQIGREHRPAIPVDQNGLPTVDVDDPQFQGVNLDVFPDHPAGSMVELYGYAALVSEDTGMMVGQTAPDAGLGGFAVARAFISNPDSIVVQPPQGPPFVIGRGIEETWNGGTIELADPVPTGTQQPPGPAQQEIVDAFSPSGGYALLIQRLFDYEAGPNLQLTSTVRAGGIEVIRYQGRQGTSLTGVQRAQRLPGDDARINPELYDGTPRRFITDFTDWPWNPAEPQVLWDDIPTNIVWVVPISLGVQNTSVLWDPAITGLSEWLQLYPRGAVEDTEWVRYDAIADNRFVVRANRARWFSTYFQLAQSTGVERVRIGPLGPQNTPAGVATPPWGNVAPSSGFIGYTPQLESTFPQIQAVRRALSFRGDPFTGTSSHPQANATVTPCHRLQLLWGNYGAYTGRVGRHDRVALVQGSLASGSDRPLVEWHTVTWQARRYGSDNLQQNRTPDELLGPWPFQLVAFKQAVGIPMLGPPRGTAVDDPRRFDRIVKFPSGELPAAFCPTPTIGAGVAGEQPVQGLVDEVEVTGHAAPDLVLDDVCAASARSFTVNRPFTTNSAGALWSQTDLSALFPPSGGLVQIDREILAYQTRQDGVFTIAQNGRGLLNTEPRDHDRGARVMFLTHRPAAILASGVGANEASLPLQAIGPLPRAGTLLLGTELLHYCWARTQVETLEMPRWYPPPADGPFGGRDETASRGLFRGRYGTVPQGAGAGEVVISWPFRYWDRYAEQSDDPELAYFQLTTNEAPVFFRDVRWREETRDPRVEVICRVRTDGLASWAADPAVTEGLWQFQGGSDQAAPHRLGRQAARLEVRFQTVYRPGAIDMQTFRSHGWKTTARVEDVRVEYEGRTRVFDEEVTAR